MLQRFSGKLVNYLLEKGIIRDDDREIYIYGLLALFSTVINFFFVLTVGIFAGLSYETLIYLLGFALLRCYCGGYHAKTQLGCVLGFTAVYALSMLVYCFLSIENGRLFSMITAGVCLIFIFITAPVEHKNRTFKGNEYNQFRLASRIIALIYGCIIYSIAIFFSQFIMVSLILSLAMLSVSFVLALALV